MLVPIHYIDFRAHSWVATQYDKYSRTFDSLYSE